LKNRRNRRIRLTVLRTSYELARGRFGHHPRPREGVALSVKADGKLGWEAAQRPSEALLGAFAAHKADILAMIAPASPSPFAVMRAKRRIAQLRALAFWPYLDGGALMIADEAGWRWRSVAEYLPIGEVFDDLVAGLAENPRLLDPYRRGEK
jgi:hypothetical protein